MCMPTLPKIFRPVTRNTLIFYIWPKLFTPKRMTKALETMATLSVIGLKKSRQSRQCPSLYGPLDDKSAYLEIIFLISRPKH